jgi:hypothetical protein
MASPTPLDRFLEPLHVDLDKIHQLSERFFKNFDRLAAESTSQFLATPISESILRPVSTRGSGRYVSPICKSRAS